MSVKSEVVLDECTSPRGAEVNIRERGGRRKQKPDAGKHVLSVFGIYSVSGIEWSVLVA